ncbi:Abi family protein [Corynebacterium sp. NPDC060344]|uniref:Abi family protein n=1 Tax=Corynebacterium sp. NPDC060344 TaxID=3347101 RepID=UPI003662C43F
MRAYGKPFLSIDEQIGLLADRGMDIGEPDAARLVLQRVGYYRLSGYWHPLRKSRITESGLVIDDEFTPGTSLAQVVTIYEFDRGLRLLAMDALERVEIALRFHIGHTLGNRGPFAHTDIGCLSAEFTSCTDVGPPNLAKWRNSDHAKWLAKRDIEIKRSKADFAVHFKRMYELPTPVWVTTELIDFGGLSTLYSGLLQADRDTIAAHLGLRDKSGAGHGGALKDWLSNLTYVRNVCAHHARFWNANMANRLSTRHLKAFPELMHAAGPSTARPYSSLAVLAVLSRRLAPEDDWPMRLRAHIHENLPNGRSPAELGCPAAWDREPIWDSRA